MTKVGFPFFPFLHLNFPFCSLYPPLTRAHRYSVSGGAFIGVISFSAALYFYSITYICQLKLLVTLYIDIMIAKYNQTFFFTDDVTNI